MAYFRCGGTPSDILALPTIGEASQADICQFNTDLTMNLLECICEIKATQSGSGTPSPANPRAINGHSELNLVRCGINLWNEEWELGIFDNATGEKLPNNSNSRTKNMTIVAPNTQYAIIEPDAMRLFFYAEDKSYISTMVVPTNNNIITTPNNCHYINFQFGSTSYNNDRGINYPSTDTSYHAYHGTPYLVSFGQTVYGGVYDANAGKVRITHAYETVSSFSGSVESNGFRTNTYLSQPVKEAYGALTCNMFTRATNYNQAVGQVQNAIGYNAAGQILLNAYDNGAYITNINDLNALIPDEGCQIVYELATPIEIDVSELSVDTIVGVNNVFADTGRTQVKFFETVGHHIA